MRSCLPTCISPKGRKEVEDNAKEKPINADLLRLFCILCVCVCVCVCVFAAFKYKVILINVLAL